ncbi:hypothetical protein A3197_17575 [Candidatus Thiodiazotropha endoloripes]|nr:hypothetical protein A3197_17575 [Candidatus Thiodiazotropha endoloripes]
MKTYTATHEKRPTKLAGLLTKLNAFRQTPAWVKTRRFFWAVGVVLLDVIAGLLSGAASASKAQEDGYTTNSGGPVRKDRLTGVYYDEFGNPCNTPVNPSVSTLDD